MAAGLVCTECGSSTTILFKEYSKSVLKLHNCETCWNPVDKYVECDESMVFMDVVLQKVPAYRHTLYNAGFKAFWKLGILSVIFTGYVQWNIAETRKPHRKTYGDFSFELDWTFYLACLQSAIEFGVYVTSILCVSWSFDRRSTAGSHSDYKKLTDGLMLANFGQTLALPTVIWVEWVHHAYLCLTLVLVILSNVQVYRAVCSHSKLWSWSVVLFGFSVRILMSKLLDEQFSSGIFRTNRENVEHSVYCMSRVQSALL